MGQSLNKQQATEPSRKTSLDCRLGRDRKLQNVSFLLGCIPRWCSRQIGKETRGRRALGGRGPYKLCDLGLFLPHQASVFIVQEGCKPCASGSASCSISWYFGSLLQAGESGSLRMPAAFPCKVSQRGRTQNGDPRLLRAQLAHMEPHLPCMSDTSTPF